MRIFKRILFFVVGFLVFILGLICLMLPFLPFGWLLIIVSLLLFMPYFPFFKRWLSWLEKKDRTGFSKKMKKYSISFYNWTHDIQAPKDHATRGTRKPSVIPGNKRIDSSEIGNS